MGGVQGLRHGMRDGQVFARDLSKEIIFQVFARGLLRNNRDVPLCAIACSNVTSKSTDDDDFFNCFEAAGGYGKEEMAAKVYDLVVLK